MLTPAKMITVAVAMAALAGCSGGSTSGTGSAAKKEGPVLAEVNGGTITAGEFNAEIKNLPEYLKSMAETPQGRKEMLDTMVIRELILQQAAKDGIDKSAEVESKLQDLRKRIVVEAYLKKKVETESNVSDADLKKFYDQNLDKFKAGEQIRASHILVKTEKEAKDLLAQIKAGGNFEELAKKSSVDSSAAKGGDLGWFGKGSMVPAFEKAVFSLKEGQVSDVVKSDFGYHIIKLTGKRPAGARPFDEVKEQIKAALLPGKQQEVFQKIKEDLKKNAKIAIKEDALAGLDAKKDAAKTVPPQPAQPAPQPAPQPAAPPVKK